MSDPIKDQQSKNQPNRNVAELSIVIPVFNEAENIANLIQELISVLNGKLFFEIVVVDDGSTDSTADLLMQYRDTYPHLRALRLTTNCGQSAALIAGIQAACSDWIVTMDGDGQNDPADIIMLFQKARNFAVDEHPLVVGTRINRRDSWLRKMSSRIANAIRQSLLHDDCPDTGCSLKVFEKELFEQLPKFNHMHRFLPALFKREGATIVNVTVNHRPRVHGESKYGVINRLWVGIIDLFGMIWLRQRAYQIKLDNEH